MIESDVIGEEITHNQFRSETYHRFVRYVLHRKDGIVKNYEHKQFYCNKDYKSKQYSIPRMCLSMEGKFYKITNNSYQYVSPYGQTVFTVQ